MKPNQYKLENVAKYAKKEVVAERKSSLQKVQPCYKWDHSKWYRDLMDGTTCKSWPRSINMTRRAKHHDIDAVTDRPHHPCI